LSNKKSCLNRQLSVTSSGFKPCLKSLYSKGFQKTDKFDAPNNAPVSFIYQPSSSLNADERFSLYVASERKTF